LQKVKDKTSIYMPHIGIIVLLGFVIICNVFFTDLNVSLAGYSPKLYSEIDAAQAAKFINEAEKYTPILEENSSNYAFNYYIEKSDGFASKELGDNSINTQIAEKDFEYIVQQGDTITTIAQKFDLHVASIVEKNGIDVNRIENIKSGEKLVIPADDFSTSKSWLAELNQKKEEERQLAIKAEQERQKKLAAQKKTLAASKRSTV